MTWNGQGTYAEFLNKYNALKELSDQGLLIKSSNITRSAKLTTKYRQYLVDKLIDTYGETNPEFVQAQLAKIQSQDFDVDHIHELQLGGVDDFSNMHLLDYRLNRSLGAQIAAQIAELPEGTIIVIK